MKCAYEYRPMLYFLPWIKIGGEPDFQTEETQRQTMEQVNKLIYNLPTVIEKEMSDNKGWEINSHSITVAPDKTVLVSILLQRKRT